MITINSSVIDGTIPERDAMLHLVHISHLQCGDITLAVRQSPSPVKLSPRVNDSSPEYF